MELLIGEVMCRRVVNEVKTLAIICRKTNYS